ncbi:MAG: pantoate--beta-alanine ligase [Bacteroidetes bacterium]|nr:MAG: pantoate--beta-alanine ligase [Bacteroidota bacterium]
MLTFSKIKETTDFLEQEINQGRSIGFVPTMGALHEGHLELMRRAKKENDLLVVSIFVNPIQFNKSEDLEKYPRNLEADKKLLETVGCNVLFSPETEEMYPEEVNEKYDFWQLETVMEGAHRPGHFNGVAIVVKKLFEIVKPQRAYFGEKDFQQLAIIQKLVEMKKMPVEIVPCPIVREADGLAMSSRNARLTPEERTIAPRIFEILQYAKSKKDSICTGPMKQMVINMFEANEDFLLEYFEIADDKNLQAVTSWGKGEGIMGFVALQLGNVRLIDNVRFI